MKQHDPSKFLDEIAREHVPADLDLTPRVMAQIEKGIRKPMKLKWKILTAAVVTLLALTIVTFTVPEVAQAMQKLLGYIPGIGAVDQSAPLRILPETVTNTQDEFTLQVTQGVLDSEHTVISFQVDGPFPPVTFTNGPVQNICYQQPSLRLPDGTLLESGEINGSSWASGYADVINFAAIPADVNEATLVLPCLTFMPDGQGPQNWEIPLRFVAAPPDLTVYPVIEFATPTGAAETTEPQTGTASAANGVTLALNNAVALDAGYFMQISVDWKQNPDIQMLYVNDDALHLTDPSGYEIPTTLGDGEGLIIDVQNQTSQMDVSTGAPAAEGELALTMDYVMVDTITDTTFTFDPGPNPQPGQVWEINQDLNVDGYTLRILSVRYSEVNSGEAGLVINMESPDGISMANIADPDHRALGGGGGGGGGMGPTQTFESGFTYAEGFPQGPITLMVAGITQRFDGPWTVTWTPPAGSVPLDTAGAPCLTDAAWEAAMAQSSASLPEEIGGKLAYYGIDETGSYFEAITANADGSNAIHLGEGQSPSFNPDGSQVVYSAPDGLYLYDVAAGTAALIPGTAAGDINPVWSPDGATIAFVRGQQKMDIYLVQPDGSNIRAVASSFEAENLVGWTPDSASLVYFVPGGEGSTIYRLDLQSGESTALFSIHTMYPSMAISSDGARLAFSDEEAGGMMAVYTANLDGSDRKRIAGTNTYTTLNPFWAPGGTWLALTVFDPASSAYNPDLALVNVDTCQVVVNPGIAGYPTSWIP